MKRILSIKGHVSNFDRPIFFAKKLQEHVPTDLEMENIPLQDLSNLVQQVNVATREAATNTNLNMQEIPGINKALKHVQEKIINSATNLSKPDKQ